MNQKGISRKRKKSKKVAWNYYNAAGKLISDKKIIDRCNKLVLPPAWKDVWISTNPNAHLQATGKDVKGRLQYKYHTKFTKARSDEKFDGILTFANTLSIIRKKIQTDIRLPGMPKNKVVALIVMLIDRYHFRVGNDEYAKKNKSYGLTTLKKGHVTIDKSGQAEGKMDIIFEFKGKSNQQWKTRITEDKLALLIKASGDLTGKGKNNDLFCYEDENGSHCDIKANHINEYLDSITPESTKITSKEFRTWAATWKTAFRLSQQKDADAQYAKKRIANEVVKTVAEDLRNTVTVCRSSYIHPVILEDWLEGSFRAKWNAANKGKNLSGLSKQESITVRYLDKRKSNKKRSK